MDTLRLSVTDQPRRVATRPDLLRITGQRSSDLEADLEAKDDEQIRWMWLPGEREAWEVMTPAQQRAHAATGLQGWFESFGTGPKWTFAADASDARYVAYIDCDIASDHVPAGEANISYSCHPSHRGKGYVSRAVRLVMCFLHDHTGARQAHILANPQNAASLRVARAVGAAPQGRSSDGWGHTLMRHILTVDRRS